MEAAASRLGKEGQGAEEGDKLGEVALQILSCDLTLSRHFFALYRTGNSPRPRNLLKVTQFLIGRAGP